MKIIPTRIRPCMRLSCSPEPFHPQKKEELKVFTTWSVQKRGNTRATTSFRRQRLDFFPTTTDLDF